MRLLVEAEINPAGAIVAAGIDELRWPLPRAARDKLQKIEKNFLRANGTREFSHSLDPLPT